MLVDFYLRPDDGPTRAPQQVRWATDLGFDGVFTAETGHDPFLPIAAAASAGDGLDFGTAIAVAFPRSPMVTAMTAWDLQVLTGGRFLLGLGTQVRSHIVRRFSTTWEPPGPRLRDYVGALRAIWACFREEGPLSYEGEFYRFSLMTPFFNPGPIDQPDPAVYISAVGDHNARLAGEICDGIHIHPFHTPTYLRERLLPAIAEGRSRGGRGDREVTRAATVLCVTGSTDAEFERSLADVRRQIAFYASTPAYAPVLETEGWEEVGVALRGAARRGEWDSMGDLITDEMVERVAVVAPPDRLGAAVRERCEGLVDRVGAYTLSGGLREFDDAAWATLVGQLRG